MPKYRNSIFAVVDPNQDDNEEDERYSIKNKKSKNSLQHLGFEDTVLNHLLLIRDIEKN